MPPVGLGISSAGSGTEAQRRRVDHRPYGTRCAPRRVVRPRMRRGRRRKRLGSVRSPDNQRPQRNPRLATQRRKTLERPRDRRLAARITAPANTSDEFRRDLSALRLIATSDTTPIIFVMSIVRYATVTSSGKCQEPLCSASCLVSALSRLDPSSAKPAVAVERVNWC